METRSTLTIMLLILLAVAAPTFLVGAMKIALYVILGIILLFVILALSLRSKIKSMQERMAEQMRNSGMGGEYSNTQNRDKEGDVKVYKTKTSSEKKVSKGVGDYVDFEEIKKN